MSLQKNVLDSNYNTAPAHHYPENKFQTKLNLFGNRELGHTFYGCD